MPQSALLAWLFFRSVLTPHEPATLNVPAAELPAARSAYGWIETSVPQIISDRFDSGGLTLGVPVRLGVHGTSAADTTFRVNGLEATSTLRPGAPMVLPEVVGASSISATRLASNALISAPGPAIDWMPANGAERKLVAETFFMPSAFAITPSSTSALPIEQLRSLADGSLLLSGALVPGKSNAMFAGHWARANRLVRSNPTEVQATQLSLVGHLTFTPNDRDEADVLAIVQRATPSSTTSFKPKADGYGTAQISWRRTDKGRASYHAAGGYQWMDATPGITTSATIDTAFDGAVYPAIFRPAGSEQVFRATGDVTVAPHNYLGVTHHFQAVAEFSQSTMTPSLASTSLMAEKVNGVAARVWRVDVPANRPSWTSSMAAIAVNDRVGTEHAWIEGGVRAESLSAANGGTASIAWGHFLPHAGFQFSNPASGLGIFGTFTRTGARLPPMALAYGDVNAPNANVYRWIDTNANGIVDGTEGTGTSNLIARVGPGGANGLTAMNDTLKRPLFDLFMGGVSFEKGRLAASATAIRRTQANFIRPVADGGAAYTTVTQKDPNADFTDSSDDQLLAAFSRTSASFGLDHYLLTNPAGVGETSSYTLDISTQYRGPKVRLAFSAAAIKATGTSSNRGFRSDENDPGLIGEVIADPNATTYSAKGRTFFDRGYVGKILGVFTLPADTTLGIVARYQDGQPFSRLNIFSNLNQGPEAVVSYGAGRPTRFKFISTTDVRLQKSMALGTGRATLIIDAFNVFNIGREVEEYVLTNAAFRAVTAIEPPRTIRIGLRFSY